MQVLSAVYVTVVQIHTPAGMRSPLQVHANTFLTMQHVCCSGTSSAVRAILPLNIPHTLSHLSFSTFTPRPFSSPSLCHPLLLVLPLHPLPLSSPALLPPEAGDVEGCSAVSDYQAWLCERNDNHCAALQRERVRENWGEQEEGRDGWRGGMR